MDFLAEIPPWVGWPAAIAGALLGFGFMWKYVIVGVGRALWAAVLAAPQIADGVQELGDLLRGDVLGRLDTAALRFEALEAQQSMSGARLDVITARLDAHELAIGELRALNTAARVKSNGDA